MQDLLMNLVASAPADHSTLFVVLMGIGTVFVGLICIIVLCMIVGAIIRASQSPAQEQAPVVAAPVAPAAATEIPNKQELIAAVSAAIAEDMGTDVSAIRIFSVKRL